MRKISILLTAILLCNSIHSQSAAELYKNVIKTGAKKEFTGLNVEVFSYGSKTDKTPELMGKGSMKRHKTTSYVKYDGQEMLYGDKYTLVVNHDSKTIDYYEHDEQKKPKLNTGFFQQLDSTLAEFKDNLQYNGVQGSQLHFSILTPDEIIIRTDLYFDKTSNLLTKIVYTYSDSNEDQELGVSVAVILYKDYSFSKKELNETVSTFIAKNGNKYIGVNSYRSFKVNYFKS